jgi:trk system potassium uptake protein TrkH
MSFMLHPRRVVAAIGAITRLYSTAFFLPLLVALGYDAYDVNVIGLALPRAVLVFAACFGITYMLGAWLRIIARDAGDDLADREAYLTVGLGWLILCAVSMLPFMLTGVLSSPVDAFFEAMSGLTTTGATVIGGDLESVAPSLMMWRAFLQFIGGMGIIVLSVAVLARLTQGGMQLLQAEVPGLGTSRIAPRLANTARLMWSVYLALAATLFVLLAAILVARHGMSIKMASYEAMMHTFTTMSTGGFSNHTTSIAFFADPLIEAVIIGFVLIAGTNFTLLLIASRGGWRAVVADGEWRLYMANFIIVTTVVSGFLWRAGYNLLHAVRGSSFVVASMMTSTGFVTEDYDAWPTMARLLIVFVMVAGGMGGSTAGGFKMVRILLLWKIVRREIQRLQHPNAVIPIRIAGRIVKPQTVMATVGLFFAFVAFWLVGTALLEATDPAFSDVTDAASASLSALSNVGPGLGVVGPTQTFAGLTTASKLILTAEMWFGRLEIFTALLVFLPETWRH